MGRGLGGDWIVGATGTEGFVGRFDAGALRWSQAMSTATFHAVSAGVVVGVQTGGVPAPLVARYDPSGALLWSHAYVAPTGQQFFGGDFRSVATTADAVVSTGAVTDPINFGGGALTAPYTADVVLAAFTSDGAYRSATRFPAPFSDYGNAMTVTATGPVVAGNAQAAAFLTQFSDGNPSEDTSTPTTTPTATMTKTASPSATVTASAIPTVTSTPTDSPTATASASATATRTDSETPTATATASRTDTAVPIRTASATATYSPRPTDSAVPTETATEVPTATASEAPTAAPVLRICDVTRNGTITALDATRILQFVAGLVELDDEQRLLADASGNGSVSSLDAVMILRWSAGLTAQAPRCGRPLTEDL